MSVVSNVMLGFSISEDEDARIAELHQGMRDRGHKQEFHCNWDSDEAWGGFKACEKPVWAAAFNYVNTQIVLDAVRHVRWEEPEAVQLLVCEQESDVFEIYTITNGGTA
jgi:hypothetical protein